MGGGIANVHSRYENGQLIFYEAGHRQRIVDAIGPNVIKYINDFAGDQGAENWIETAVSVGSGTSVMASRAEAGGMIRLDLAGNDNDAYQIQKLAGFVATASDPIYFGCRFEYSGAAADAIDVMIGLCSEDTDLVGAVADGIYFCIRDGAADLFLTTEDNGSATDLTLTATSVVDTWNTCEFYFNGDSTTPAVYAWHNGDYIGRSTAGIEQTNALAISIAVANGAAAGESVTGLHVDYVRAFQLLATR